jgi:hypothetical protein
MGKNSSFCRGCTRQSDDQKMGGGEGVSTTTTMQRSKLSVHLFAL